MDPRLVDKKYKATNLYYNQDLNRFKDLTVGMATYKDWAGVWATVQSMRIYHGVTNIIVVDNAPNTDDGKATKDFCTKVGAMYVAMPENTGTTQPRQRVFDLSQTKYTMCVDSHIMLENPKAIEQLMDYYAKNPETGDLLSGPMVYDWLTSWETQFDDEWRSEMHGVWGRDLRGDDIEGEPFEVWGQGLGLFTCRTEAWQGFNPHFRGFGGEEGYIHEKFRQAGYKALCLPFLRWNHRFGRPGGIPYPLTRWNKVRNHVLGHLELGWPLDRIYDHFVKKHLLNEREWNYLIEDPIGHESPPGDSPAKAAKNPRQSIREQKVLSIETLFEIVQSKPRDLNEHAITIREYAKDQDNVVAFVKRQEWNVLLAAGNPKRLVVYQTENGELIERVHQALEKKRKDNQYKSRSHKDEFFYQTIVGPDADSLKVEPVGKVDLLVIDTFHSADRIYHELNQHGKNADRILCRGTATYGLKSEIANTPGLLFGMDRWMRENPEWFISDHYPHQYGITIMSRLPEDKPEHPINLIPPGKGPGTELKKILASMEINPSPTCDCNGKSQQMDLWGAAECREKFDVIVGWMRDNQQRWGWKDKIKAAALAVKTGLAFKLDPLDPFPSLIEEAIRRAEENELPNS